MISPISIAFDHQIFVSQKYGGISRYFYEIALRLSKNDNFNVNIYAGLHQNKYLEAAPSTLVTGNRIPYLPGTLPFFISFNSYMGGRILRKNIPDVVHETYYESTNLSDKSKIVTTIHDMIPEKFSNSTTNQTGLLAKKAALERADHVICVSNHTRQDLLELFDLPVEKVSTIYHGYSLQEFGTLKQSAPLVNAPYILYVGDWRSPYKNFKRLLKAYGSKKHFQDEFKLACIGSRRVSKDILEAIKDAGVSATNVLFFSGSDLTLANLYGHALALVYPSLYEGFGIPPLEAMSFGCPVICSNVSSIPEIVSDGGYYFDPYDVDSISSSIEKVLSSLELQQQLTAKGKERVKFFSWDKCAAQTSSIYKQLI